mgnify:CR=1 FL=1
MTEEKEIVTPSFLKKNGVYFVAAAIISGGVYFANQFYYSEVMDNFVSATEEPVFKNEAISVEIINPEIVSKSFLGIGIDSQLMISVNEKPEFIDVHSQFSGGKMNHNIDFNSNKRVSDILKKVFNREDLSNVVKINGQSLGDSLALNVSVDPFYINNGNGISHELSFKSNKEGLTAEYVKDENGATLTINSGIIASEEKTSQEGIKETSALNVKDLKLEFGMDENNIVYYSRAYSEKVSFILNKDQKKFEANNFELKGSKTKVNNKEGYNLNLKANILNSWGRSGQAKMKVSLIGKKGLQKKISTLIKGPETNYKKLLPEFEGSILGLSATYPPESKTSWGENIDLQIEAEKGFAEKPLLNSNFQLKAQFGETFGNSILPILFMLPDAPKYVKGNGYGDLEINVDKEESKTVLKDISYKLSH